MLDSTPQRSQLLPTVSIVEETMRQSRRALMLALAGVTLITLVLLGERLGSSEGMQIGRAHV